jgi:hypothetical protein
MSTPEDAKIVLRAAVTLRGLQRSLLMTEKRTVEYARLLTAVKRMEAQFDEALEVVRDQIREPDRYAAD